MCWAPVTRPSIETEMFFANVLQFLSSQIPSTSAQNIFVALGGRMTGS